MNEEKKMNKNQSKTVTKSEKTVLKLPKNAVWLGVVCVTINEGRSTVVAIGNKKFLKKERPVFGANVKFADGNWVTTDADGKMVRAEEGEGRFIPRYLFKNGEKHEVFDRVTSRFISAINAPVPKAFQPTYESLLEKSKKSAIAPK